MITAVTEQVAKLMATENITVCLTNDTTASFSLKTRILRIPNWTKLTPVEMDLLIGHEIGHALYTDKDKWCDEIENFEGNKGAFKRCLNVIEDARIERNVKIKYPGMRKVFFHGYTLLLNRKEFGYKQESLKTTNAVDFINAYFKFDGILHFNNLRPELKDMVEEVKNTETIEDVIVVAHKLYAIAKDFLSKAKNEKDTFSNFDNDEKPSAPAPVEIQEEEEEEGSPVEEEEETTSEPGQGETTQEESDEEGEGEEVEGEGSSNLNEDKDESKVIDSKSSEGAGGQNNSSTDEEMDEIGNTEDELGKVSKAHSGDKEVQYRHMALPEPTNLNKIITPYKAILNDLETMDTPYWLKTSVKKNLDSMKSSLKEGSIIESDGDDEDKEYSIANPMEKFYKEYFKTISLYKKIFEMRKKARQHNRTMRFRTGVIDPEQLYSYKYNDQLFKTHEVKENGKNHGLIFILDLSSSMQKVFRGAIKNMMQQIMFCRESGIPFVVYGFSSCINRDILPESDQFKVNNSYEYYIGLNSFTLLELLSSEMNQYDFKRMFKFCFTVLGADRRGVSYYGLGSTPLDQTVLCLEELTKKFKSINNVQEINIVFLTDGASDHTSVRSIDPGNHYSYNYKYVIVDPKTKNTVCIEDCRISTEVLLKMVRKRLARLGNVSVVNFRIVESYMRLPFGVSREENPYDFAYRNPFISRKEYDGFTEYFFVNRNVFSAKSNSSFNKELKGADNLKQIQDVFTTKSSIKKAHMKMIENFIDNIV